MSIVQGRIMQNMVFHAPNRFARLARYCGKMCNRHLFFLLRIDNVREYLYNQTPIKTVILNRRPVIKGPMTFLLYLILPPLRWL